MSFYLPCCWASRKPIASVEFKFVARQVVASVVIRAAKPKFVAESRTRVYFAQHVASTCNIVFCCETSWYKHGNTRNNVFQLAMQQCCKTLVEKKCCPYYRTLTEQKRTTLRSAGSKFHFTVKNGVCHRSVIPQRFDLAHSFQYYDCQLTKAQQTLGFPVSNKNVA